MRIASTAAGRIVTFYSYKGGTGRSMALANIAFILASNGKKVLTIDWDLEAPGLHQYFRPFLADPELGSSKGLIDMVWDFALAAMTPADAQDTKQTAEEPDADFLDYAVGLRWEFPAPGLVHFIPAGRQGPSYAQRVNSFNWQNFYERLGGGAFLEKLKERVKSDYDYVLIDSRTGVSDTAGVCTVQLPDDVVVFFTGNNQSIDGSRAVVESIRAQAKTPKRIFPVMTRVDTSEMEKLNRRKDRARQAFDRIPPVAAEQLDAYWASVEVPYVPWYAYEEVLAVFFDRALQKNSLLAAAEALTARLTSNAVTHFVAPSETERQRVIGATQTRDAARYDVYLSYRHHDREVALRVATYLRDEAKLRVWFDEWALLPGDDFKVTSEQGMRASGAYVCLFGGPPSAEQEAEVDGAIRLKEQRQGYRIIPIRVGPQVTELDPKLAGFQYLSISNPPNDVELRRLESGIRGIPFQPVSASLAVPSAISPSAYVPPLLASPYVAAAGKGPVAWLKRLDRVVPLSLALVLGVTLLGSLWSHRSSTTVTPTIDGGIVAPMIDAGRRPDLAAMACDRSVFALVGTAPIFPIYKFAGSSALFFAGGMTIDPNGAPKAYHPDDKQGLDHLANAGRPGAWRSLLTDGGRPVKQCGIDPAPGFYIAPTLLQDSSMKRIADPRRYVDSNTVPYLALSTEAQAVLGMNLGDFAMAIRLESGQRSGAIFADIRNPASVPVDGAHSDRQPRTGHVGGGSILLALKLGLNESPRNGGAERGVLYVVFPGSGGKWPIPVEEIDRRAEELFQKWGGMARAYSCFPGYRSDGGVSP